MKSVLSNIKLSRFEYDKNYSLIFSNPTDKQLNNGASRNGQIHVNPAICSGYQ